MRMRLAFVAAGLAIGTLVGAVAAQAASYNLGTDLSGANAPGSPWTVTFNSGSDVTITWTAPTDGILDNLDFAAWYAHSSVTRSNDVSLAIDGDPGSPHSWVTSTFFNSNRGGAGGLSGGGLSLNAGDLITL